MSTALIASSPISQDEINNILWKACDTFRGTVDPSKYKNYILALLFVKYISDVWQDHFDEFMLKYKGDETRVRRQLDKDTFKLPKGCTFPELYAQQNEPNLGEIINKALEVIEDANKEKLEGVFRSIDFNSEANLGRTKERNERLKNLLDAFNDERLDLRPSRTGNHDVIGDAYTYFIGKIASGVGEREGEFFTPSEISELLVNLLDPKPGEQIYDPACGLGSLLIKCAKHIGTDNYALYGQEKNGSTWVAAKMNMLFHNVTSARIEWGDTLRNPLFIENGNLSKFDVVITNPPFGMSDWGYEEWQNDKFGRNVVGLPSRKSGDFAWILHAIASMENNTGRAAIIVPSGILFRSGAEQTLRQYIIENDLLEAVISLAPNLLNITSIPVNILLLRTKKPSNKKGKVLFINASTLFESRGMKNFISDKSISQILSWHQNFVDVPGSVNVAFIKNLGKTGWNLNTSHYIKPAPGKLLENAIVSIRLGLDDFEMETEERIISSIRNLYAGILLLFKEKLLRLSPDESEEVLIKSEIVPVNEGGKIKFKGTGTKTIEFDQIKKRFGKLGVKFDWQRVEKIQKKRNEIEHYYTTDKKSAIREVISNTFIVISDFIKNELNEDPRELLGLKYWNAMLSTSELYEDQRKNCLDLLSKINWQPTSIDVNDIRCSSCGSTLIAPVMPAVPKVENQYFDCVSCGQAISYNDLIAPLKNEEPYFQISMDEMSN
jgi:type I restriction enzyme M protein